MVVSEHGAAEICVVVTGNVENTYVWFDCLDIIQWILSQDGCFTNTVYVYITRSDFIHVNCPGRVRAGDVFYYSHDVLLSSCHGRAQARDPVAHHLVTESRLRPSFLRSPCADRRFFLRPAAEPMTYSGRPPRPRPHRRPSSAVQPRHWPTWATLFYRITILTFCRYALFRQNSYFHLKHSTEQFIHSQSLQGRAFDSRSHSTVIAWVWVSLSEATDAFVYFIIGKAMDASRNSRLSRKV